MTIDVDRLPAGATVFDLVYVPAETPLLARGAGARPPRRQRVGDADRAGRDRVRALDRRGRHGRRHARGGRAAARRPAASAPDRCVSRRSSNGRPSARGRSRRRGSCRIADRDGLAEHDARRSLPAAPAALERVRGLGASASRTPAYRALDDVGARAGRARPGRDLHDRAQLPRARRRGPPASPTGRSSTASCRRRSPATAAIVTLGSDADRQRRSPRSSSASSSARRPSRRAGRGARSRLRLHVRQRHLVARPVARRRPVAARQVDGRVLPGRPVGRDAPTSSTRPTSGSAARSTASPIQDGRTEPDALLDRRGRSSYLSRHIELRPGDLIATGTPARLAGPPGPERHLQAGDVVTVWIERIGELTTSIA